MKSGSPKEGRITILSTMNRIRAIGSSQIRGITAASRGLILNTGYRSTMRCIRLPDGYAFADERGSIEELHSGNFEIIRE